jgi:hypothetical protein
MAVSFFDDKSQVPGESELAKVLGRTSKLWDQLKDLLATRYEPLTEEWKFYSKKSGWSLPLKRKKRTVLYLIPCKGYFIAAFVLGEKAVKAARESDLPASIVERINKAKKYVEGRGISIEVRSKKDLSHIEKLAEIKMAN